MQVDGAFDEAATGAYSSNYSRTRCLTLGFLGVLSVAYITTIATFLPILQWS